MTEERSPSELKAIGLAVRARSDIDEGSDGVAKATAEALLAIHYDLARIADALDAHPHSVPIPDTHG